jgi:hypothetical protein
VKQQAVRLRGSVAWHWVEVSTGKRTDRDEHEGVREPVDDLRSPCVAEIGLGAVSAVIHAPAPHAEAHASSGVNMQEGEGMNNRRGDTRNEAGKST